MTIKTRIQRWSVCGLFLWLAGFSLSAQAQVPNAPSNLVAVAVSTNQINLSWIDRSSIETGFKIERAADVAGNPGTWTQIATVGVNSTAYTNTGLSANTKYWYRVRAYRGSSNSSYSNQANATTFLPPPAAPSNLTATAFYANQIILSWTDNSNTEAGFTIERSLDGTNFTQVAQVLPNTTTYRSAGLWPGLNYYFRVRAFNSAGNSSYSNIGTANTPELCSAAVVGWGPNYYGQGIPPAGLTGVVSLAAGTYHGLALKSDGTVVGWGRNEAGQATPPVGLTGVIAICGGYGHSLALKSDGAIVGWGDSNYGQTSPPSLADVVAIAAGDWHSLALKSDGTVVGWGDNDFGQATPPTSLSGVVAIDAGRYHSLALRSDGTVVGWGYNYDGQATPPAGLTGVVAIATGQSHSLALLGDGTVVGWGNNFYGQMPPTNLNGVIAISAGDYNGLALRSDGTVVGWGSIDAPPTNLTAGVAIAAGGAWNGLALQLVLNTPQSLVATAISSNQINLTWTYSPCREDGFQIERALDNAGVPGAWAQIATTGTNVSSYSDTGLLSHTKYWYRVRSYGAIGESPYSNLATATTPCAVSDLTTILSQPVSQTVCSGGTASFSVGASGVSPTYRWRRNGTNLTDGASVTGATTPTLTLSNLTSGAYDVVVSGVCGIQTSAVATLTVIAPAGAPSALTATAVSSNQISLAWTGNGVVDTFKIERAPDSAGNPGTWAEIAAVGSNVNSYTDSDLPSDARFWYRVRAHNVCGDTPYGNQANATAPSQPGAPSTLMATPLSATRIDLSWTDNSSTEYGFLIERAPDNGGLPGIWTLIATASVNAVSYSDNGLTPNTKYWYRLRAYNVAGYSDYCTAATATTALFTPPSGLFAVALSTNTIHLGWSDNSSNEDGFKIERAADNSGAPDTWAQITTVNSNTGSYDDTGLSDGTRYWYRVRAYNTLGDSDYSGTANATTPLSSPTNLAAVVASESQIDLSWADNSVGEDGYTVERSASVKGSQYSVIATTSVNVATYSDYGASCGPALYRVRAYKASLVSGYSNIVTANTASVDSDTDGIADCWAKQFFGHPTGQANDNSRATDDADGDGQNNLAEFMAGTDPTNGTSAFRIFSITNTASYVQIRWTIGAGRGTSVVQAASSLAGSYSNVSQNIINFDIQNEPPSYTERGDVTNAPARFYRVRLVP